MDSRPLIAQSSRSDGSIQLHHGREDIRVKIEIIVKHRVRVPVITVIITFQLPKPSLAEEREGRERVRVLLAKRSNPGAHTNAPPR